MKIPASLVGLGIIVLLVLSHGYRVVYTKHEHRMYMEIGTLLSSSSCVIIMWSYLVIKRQYRRHPNALLFWKSVADLVFSIRFLIPIDDFISDSNCILLASVSQFFALSSECWFFVISLDLWFCATNPFLNINNNFTMYHTLAWGFGLVSAIALGLSETNYNVTQGDLCWFRDADFSIAGVLYYSVVIVFALGAITILILEHRVHDIPGGMKQALKARARTIRSIRIATLAYSIYQLLALSLWIADESSKAQIIRNTSAFVHGSKGVINLISWFAINGCPKWLEGSWDLPSLDDDVDIELAPQLNTALRQEVLHFTSRGITAAACQAATMKLHEPVVTFRIHELGMSVKFNDYEPLVFYEMRRGFGLSETEYVESFTRTCHERMQKAGGSSGAFMYYTADYNFIVKSVTQSERAVLLRMLPRYLEHMQEHPKSHLTRFYGCHSIFMYGQSFSFVVMGNVIGKISMHQFYDIKGSWIDRNAEAIQPGKTMICTYCSEPFQSGSLSHCEYSLRGNHMPFIVLKDNDFRKKLRLEPHVAQTLVDEIKLDCDFLCRQGIMDYSLLLSVHSAKYAVDTESIIIESGPSKRRVHEQLAAAQIEPSPKIVVPQKSRSYRFSLVKTDESIPLLQRNSTEVESFRTFDTSRWSGQRSFLKEGYNACAVVGPDYYSLGIIDILQTWTWKKRAERYWKVIVRRLHPYGISALPPQDYAERFKRKVEDIAMVPHPTEIGLYHH